VYASRFAAKFPPGESHLQATRPTSPALIVRVMRDAEPVHYEIRVYGVLDSGWSTWFGGMQISTDEDDCTTIAGPVADQAALHGLLARIRDLGLELLAVRRADKG
jgi:hypothetical protein